MCFYCIWFCLRDCLIVCRNRLDFLARCLYSSGLILLVRLRCLVLIFTYYLCLLVYLVLTGFLWFVVVGWCVVLVYWLVCDLVVIGYFMLLCFEHTDCGC